jgi:opacity protein-like surface antigen
VGIRGRESLTYEEIMFIPRFVRLALVAILALGTGLAATSRAEAQLRVGGGVVWTDLDPLGLGFQVNGYMGVPDLFPGLRLGGDITYYLPESERVTVPGLGSFESELSLLALNANAQLHLLTQDQLSVYALGGLNFSRASVSVSVPGFGSESDSETKLGLNLGGGAEFLVGFGALYGEAKYVVAGDDWARVVLGLGIRIPIGQ